MRNKKLEELVNKLEAEVIVTYRLVCLLIPPFRGVIYIECRKPVQEGK